MFKSLVEISAPYLYKHSCSVAGINVEAPNLDIEFLPTAHGFADLGRWRPDGELMFEYNELSRLNINIKPLPQRGQPEKRVQQKKQKESMHRTDKQL